MSDTDALRTELVEQLASAEYARLTGLAGSPDGQWELLPETVRNNWRGSYSLTADAVIAAEWRPASETAALIELIADLADLDPCEHFDPHGHCQTHGWFDDERPCPHGRAAELLTAADQEGGTHV